MKILDIIEGCPVTWHDATSSEPACLTFAAPMMIDDDGAGPSGGDPCHQRDTSLHFNGRPLNAQTDSYIVLPANLMRKVRGMCLGCRVVVFNPRTGKSDVSVVGDAGPETKLGEASEKCAVNVGVNANPNRGGEAGHVIHYTVVPGVPAVVAGRRYVLAPV